MVLEVGRVCVKNAGREAGKKCVVLKVLDKNFVLVASPSIRRRRCNVRHLEATDKVLRINEDASDAEVSKAFEAAFPEEMKKPTKKAPKGKAK